MDWHECSNSNTSVHAPDGRVATTSSCDAERTWSDAVKGGADQNVTVAQAEVLCEAEPTCFGFTFRARRPPRRAVAIHFKAAGSVNAAANYQSYLRSHRPPPKTCSEAASCTRQYSTRVHRTGAGAAACLDAGVAAAVHLPRVAGGARANAGAGGLPAPFASIGDASRRTYAGMRRLDRSPLVASA